MRETAGRAYQQVEIPTGPFRRVIELGVEVVAEEAKATFEDGMSCGSSCRSRSPRSAPAASRSSGRTDARGRARRRRLAAGPSIEIVSADDLESAIRSDADPPSLPEAMPILPLRDMVAYPGTLTPLAVGQERSIRLIDDVLSGDRMLALVASREPELDEPTPEQLHDVGVAGRRRRGC